MTDTPMPEAARALTWFESTNQQASKQHLKNPHIKGSFCGGGFSWETEFRECNFDPERACQRCLTIAMSKGLLPDVVARAYQEGVEAGRREGAKALQADIAQDYQQSYSLQPGTVEGDTFRQVAREVANWRVDELLAADEDGDEA